MNQPKYLIIHHTAVSYQTNHQQVWAVNRYHKEKDFPVSSLGWFVGYHLFIEASGATIRCRQDSDIGAHTVGYNDKSVAICLAGDFNKELPTNEQVVSLKKLLSQYPKLIIGPHRQFQKERTCYGLLLADDWATKLISPQIVTDAVDKEKQEKIRGLWITLDVIRSLLLKLRLLK